MWTLWGLVNCFLMVGGIMVILYSFLYKDVLEDPYLVIDRGALVLVAGVVSCVVKHLIG